MVLLWVTGAGRLRIVKHTARVLPFYQVVNNRAGHKNHVSRPSPFSEPRLPCGRLWPVSPASLSMTSPVTNERVVEHAEGPVRSPPGTHHPWTHSSWPHEIPNRGLRARVWTPGPGHFTGRKKKGESPGIGPFAESATPTFFFKLSFWPGKAVLDGLGLLARHAEVKRMV